MRSNNNLILRMRRELDKLQETENRIHNLVENEIISERFGKYLEYFCMLDFSLKEADAHASHGNLQKSVQSLTEGRIILDCIASLYIENIMLGERTLDHYQEFYELAKKKYDNYENKCCKKLESKS